MKMEINFKGINYKEQEETDVFTVRFEVTTDSWDSALEIKELVEQKLKNMLTNQKTLE